MRFKQGEAMPGTLIMEGIKKRLQRKVKTT